MSDYGDDIDDDDYGDEWLYVEDEYMQADDLAEHAVASPPPVAYDEDRADEWDRFDYFNDLEYDFEGYDDATFETHNGATGHPKIGQKRKRRVVASQGSKKQKLVSGDARLDNKDVSWLSNSPIIWRAQADRGVKTRPLPQDAQPYAVLKDWRKMAKVPNGVQKPTHTLSVTGPSSAPQTQVDDEEQDWEDDESMEDEDENEEGAGTEGIDPAALMAVLQSRLGSAGGPLSGMDPQQLLQFAMRMANNQEASDDIAGELADAMLNQGGQEDEEDEETEANLMSWVSQQRNGTDGDNPKEDASRATVDRGNQHTHIPQASRDKRSAKEGSTDVHLEVDQKPRTLEIKQTDRKRKARSPAESPSASPKKRDMKPSEAPIAADQVNMTPKTTRSGRTRR